MTSSVETKEGRVNNFIHASIIGVPGRDQSCFILRLFSIFVSTVNYGICIFAVDEFSRSWFVLAKLKLRALVWGAHSESKMRVY